MNEDDFNNTLDIFDEDSPEQKEIIEKDEKKQKLITPLEKEENVQIVDGYILLFALLSIVLGVLFLIYKGAIINWMMFGLGVIFVVLGVLDILNKKTTQGIVGIVVGAVVIIFGATLINLALLVLGVLLILWGIMNIKYISKKNIFRTLKVLCAFVLGILLVIGKFAFVDWMFIVIGVVAIINGILSLIR